MWSWILVLLLAFAVSFPLYLCRGKQYSYSFQKLLIAYAVFFIVGAFGAITGSLISGEGVFSRRLYGMVLVDFLLVFLLSPLLKIKRTDLGDFIAAPTMAVCFASKIDCCMRGCCYGCVIYQVDGERLIRFPSAIFEMLLWAIITIILLKIEHKKKAKGILWPISIVWFGIGRFLVDFLRGVDGEKRVFLIGLTAGQFWSLLVFAIGLIYLYIEVLRKLKRRPRIREFLSASIGTIYLD